MPTKNPRINISIDPPLFGVMQGIATECGVSLSTLARELIREALELREDTALATFAEEREKTFESETSLSHEQAWE
jgi:hypothetical protein